MVKIETLLKKPLDKLNGDEAGRVLVADLTTKYKNMVASNGRNAQGLLDDREKGQLVNGLSSSEDIARYNIYLYLVEFLTRYPDMNNTHVQTFENYYFRLYGFLSNSATAEDEYENALNMPLIVTEEQYKELCERERSYKGEWQLTPEKLFFNRLYEILDDYRQGKQTGINAAIDRTKTLPISNERVLEHYRDPFLGIGHFETEDGHREEEINPLIWQKLLAENELHYIEDVVFSKDVPTAFDILQDAELFYSSEQEGDKTTLFEFEKDYPEIYRFVWVQIRENIPGCEGLPMCDYFKPIISFKALADFNVFNYREKLNEFSGLNIDGYLDGYKGVAVIKVGRDLSSKVLRESFLSERLLAPDAKKIIREYIEAIEDAYIDITCTNAILHILGEKIGIPDVDVFEVDTTPYVVMMRALETLTARFSFLKRSGKTEGEQDAEVLSRQLGYLLFIAPLDMLTPNTKLIEQFTKKFDLDTITNRGIALITEMAQAVRHKLRGRS